MTTIRHLITEKIDLPLTSRLPVLFVGHGSPMNGIEDNDFSRSWEKKGAELPTPHAILCISAHWFTPGTYVHTSDKPRTIHDFYGFPERLYNIEYNCPGAPAEARATKQCITSTSVQVDTQWGLDHGAWIVLRRMFKNANIPTFQLSIDFTKPSQTHFDIGRELRILRDHGVLIIGSGNIVHNLGAIAYDPHAKPYTWAEEFDHTTTELLRKRDVKKLIAYDTLGTAAHYAVPTPDHYWPLLYTLGAAYSVERLTFFANGIVHKSISMTAFCLGS